MRKMTAMDTILYHACPMDTGPVPWAPSVYVYAIETHCVELHVYATLLSTYGGYFYAVHDVKEA